MAIALEGIPLLALLIFAVLWVLVSTTKLWLQPVLGALHDALGWVPFLGDLIGAADSAIIGVLNDAIGGIEHYMTDIWAGVVWSWNLFLSENEGFAHALWKSLDHAFTVALPDAFNDARSWVHVNVTSLDARISGLVTTVKDDVAAAERFATSEAEHALSKAGHYADGVGTATFDHAKAYTDAAVDKLGQAESAAIASAVSIANTAEHDVAAALKTAESYADAVAIPIGKDLADFEKYIQSLGLAGLIAAVPALGLLVQTIASESGLDNAACRSKVKGICGTDPLAWANLLAGIGAIGFTFSLKELYDLTRPLISEGASVIRQAA